MYIPIISNVVGYAQKLMQDWREETEWHKVAQERHYKEMLEGPRTSDDIVMRPASSRWLAVGEAAAKRTGRTQQGVDSQV